MCSSRTASMLPLSPRFAHSLSWFLSRTGSTMGEIVMFKPVRGTCLRRPKTFLGIGIHAKFSTCVRTPNLFVFM